MDINPNFSDKAKRDFEIITRANLGENKAYAELLGLYRDSIYFMLLKMVNNKSDAEDLTIETFGKAFKNIHTYTPNYAFSTWLFKIASNNCIDFLRKKKVMLRHLPIGQQDESQTETFVTVPSDAPDPEEEMITDQKKKLMQDVVKKLNPRYRRLIELRYFKEFSYQEISEELEIPIGTVKARLYRSRVLLFNILKGHKDVNPDA